METEALRNLVNRAPDWEAVAARIGRPMDGPRTLRNHNGVAVMDVRGPLFRYRSIYTWLLGGSAVEDHAIALHAALDDPTVRSIVMTINSPGGQIDGINELADMIRAAHSIKPVTAYVEGMGGSGAYWLAAAAGRIVADETAQLGSIGVRTTVVDERGLDEKLGVKRYEIISSQSPLKAQDPATDEGRKALQQTVDAMADVFIGKVAQFRGTSAESVTQDYGRGAMLLARDAVAVGMADALGSLEAILRGDTGIMLPGDQMRDMPGMRVAGGLNLPAASAASPPAAQELDEDELEEGTEDLELNEDASCTCPPGEECQCGAGEDEDESEGTEQEPDDSSIPRGGVDLMTPTEDRQRIAAILTCEEATGREQLARTLALETDHSLDAAKKLLAAAPVAAAPRANLLEQRMSQIQNPAVGVALTEGDDTTVAATVASILAHVPKNRLKAHVH